MTMTTTENSTTTEKVRSEPVETRNRPYPWIIASTRTYTEDFRSDNFHASVIPNGKVVAGLSASLTNDENYHVGLYLPECTSVSATTSDGTVAIHARLEDGSIAAMYLPVSIGKLFEALVNAREIGKVS